MKSMIVKIGLGIGLAAASLPLTACMESGYSYGVNSTWYSQPYDGWYDGYYGQIYDGYWGTDNYFYFRRNERDNYRRGDSRHFYRGDQAPDSRFRRFEGQSREPRRGTRMPGYPNNDRRDGRYNDQRPSAQWREYDYNRPDPNYGGYYADRYYREDQSYQERRLAQNDRIYRGQDGRYYCRRSDGTTGLVIGAIAGGILGNMIAPGGSETLGTILGAGAGALAGREIDRGDDVRCR